MNEYDWYPNEGNEYQAKKEKEKVMNCIECDDKIVIEGEGCAKCGNIFCGDCCALSSDVLCGDHIQPIKDCGCLL